MLKVGIVIHNRMGFSAEALFETIADRLYEQGIQGLENVVFLLGDTQNDKKMIRMMQKAGYTYVEFKRIDTVFPKNWIADDDNLQERSRDIGILLNCNLLFVGVHPNESDKRVEHIIAVAIDVKKCYEVVMGDAE